MPVMPTGGNTVPARTRQDHMHYLYLAVIAAVVLGIIVGFAAPNFAVDLKPLGTAFVNLIKMMISPIIFCTIVLGIASIAAAARSADWGCSRWATSWRCRRSRC